MGAGLVLLREEFMKESGCSPINMDETPDAIWDYVEWLEGKLNMARELLKMSYKIMDIDSPNEKITEEIEKYLEETMK